MRFIIAVGAAALFALASADHTGRIVAYSTNSQGAVVPVLTGSVTVTVTPADCTAAGECSDAALSSPTSTGTTNALTILLSASESLRQSPSPTTQVAHSRITLTPVVVSSVPEGTTLYPSPGPSQSTNALTILQSASESLHQETATSQAQSTATHSINALSVLSSANTLTSPITFPPALFTSYGLTTEATSLLSETAPTPPASSPVNSPPYGSGSTVVPTTTTVTTPSTAATGPTGPFGSSTGSVVTSGTSIITNSATVPIPPTSLSGTASPTHQASPTLSGPVTGPSTTLETATSPTGTGGGHQTTGGGRQTTGGAATATTAAPPTGDAIMQKPGALFGLFLAVAGSLFI